VSIKILFLLRFKDCFYLKLNKFTTKQKFLVFFRFYYFVDSKTYKNFPDVTFPDVTFTVIDILYQISVLFKLHVVYYIIFLYYFSLVDLISIDREITCKSFFTPT